MIRAQDVRDALARTYAAPEYALFFEVGDATGGRARRWADAIAMGLWPSRGLALQGFEIKVARNDWRSELKNPAKAESIAQYCRYWWLVTPPGIVADGELPETWGHLELQGQRLKALVKPTAREVEPISPAFLAAILRRANERDRELDQAAIAKAIERDEQRTRERVDREVDSRTYCLRSRAEGAESKLKAIYDACGLDEAEVRRLFYDGGFGNAVALVHKLGVADTYRGLRGVAKQLHPMVEAIDRLLPSDLSDDEDAE